MRSPRPAGVLAPPAAFDGVEFSRFRIAAGADREAVRAAAARMHREFLQRQRGFVDHLLLADGSGGYAALVFASSRERAIDIHERFAEDPAGRAYLDLMEPHSACFSVWRRL